MDILSGLCTSASCKGHPRDSCRCGWPWRYCCGPQSTTQSRGVCPKTQPGMGLSRCINISTYKQNVSSLKRVGIRGNIFMLLDIHCGILCL